MHPSEHEPLPYWTDDISLCEARFRSFRSSRTMVRAKVHITEEPYRTTDIQEDIVPIKSEQGIRSYILMKPYVLEPEITLTVGLRSEQTDDQAVGDVISSTWEGMRHIEVGHIRAWHYPDDRTIMIWECYYFPQLRDQPLLVDENMRRLWISTERFLLDRFSGRSKLITPFRDLNFPDDEYQQFLKGLGYQPVAKAAYGKQ